MSFAKIYVQETCAGYDTLAAHQNDYHPQEPQRMKDLECKKGQLSSQPPIPYVPPTDLVTTKESFDNLKIKLPNGTIFNMSIFFQGNTEEYLVHVVAVLNLINQKGLDMQCRKLAKTVDKLAGTLENLQKPNGPKGACYKEVQEARKLELSQIQEMLEEARKAHNKSVAKTYKLPRNLLSGDPQSQWDQVCCKLHDRDSWAGVNGQMTTGRHPCL
jgi:hypothetical protein